MSEPMRPTSSAATPGMEVRREVLGDAHVDRAVADSTPFTGRLPGLHHPDPPGATCGRAPGLDRRDAQHAHAGVAAARCGTGTSSRMHVRAAMHNGLTDEEIGEVCLHTAVYAGVPGRQQRVRRAPSRSCVTKG